MRLYRRGETWWADFGVHRGARVRQSAGTADREQAEAWARATQSRLWRQEKLGEAPPVSWEEAVLDWLGAHQHKKSLTDDKDRLRWLSERLRGKAIDAIKGEVVEALIRERSVDAAPATVNRYIAALSAVLHHARKRGRLEAVPYLRKLPEARVRIRFLTRAEAARLLAELPEHLRDMAAFTLATGLRQANVSYLEWKRVDLKRGIAWIEAEEAKGGKPIAVPLNRDAMAVLERRRGVHRRWVFTWRRRPVAKTSTRAWGEALARTKIKNFRWHDLRHTWASWHAMEGTPLYTLMELGGWKSMAMVQRYAHLAPGHLKKWAENVAHRPAHGKKNERARKRA